MLNRDTQAVLLLTAHFGGSGKDEPRPLGPKEWGEFAQWLKGAGFRPGELVNGAADRLLSEWEHPKMTVARLKFLLGRGSAMALALEKWERAGIWVLTRGDEHYPGRLKKRLGTAAPPLFFGCGDQRLLGLGGVAFIGSRNAGERDLVFTRKMAAETARVGCSVVSGGARGVDEAAMLAALEAEGTVTGVLADGLLRAASSSKYRKWLRRGDLALISPYHPEARFQVGNAMGRNKYIYSLADAAVVVTCEENSGGTWAGATENLRNQWVPVWVRSASGDGSTALEKKGARRLRDSDLVIGTLFQPDQVLQGELRGDAMAVREEGAYAASDASVSSGQSESLYAEFLNRLEPLVRENPAQVKEIQDHFELELAQVKAWLARAEEEELVEKASKRPITYQWKAGRAEQTSIFS